MDQDNEPIRYATTRTGVGRLLVASRGAGACWIAIGDTGEQLVEDLRREYPDTPLREDPAGMRTLIEAVAALAEGRGSAKDIPLEVSGTEFQRRVWDAVRGIPEGSTASYSDIARRIGRPTSMRAVAGACAANRLALAIPCHRVVGADGSITGYRWGVERKRDLLARERRSAG